MFRYTPWTQSRCLTVKIFDRSDGALHNFSALRRIVPLRSGHRKPWPCTHIATRLCGAFIHLHQLSRAALCKNLHIHSCFSSNRYLPNLAQCEADLIQYHRVVKPCARTVDSDRQHRIVHHHVSHPHRCRRLSPNAASLTRQRTGCR